MENTLRQTDESLITSSKIIREPDGAVLFQYVQKPPRVIKILYMLFAGVSMLIALGIGMAGGFSLLNGNLFYAIPCFGGSAFIIWFVGRWIPMKIILAYPGELRIVPDVGYKLRNGNLPFKDVHKVLTRYESSTDSYDIRVVTDSGTHTIARCATEVGRTALIISLQREGVIGAFES